jgi:hypothetical protein
MDRVHGFWYGEDTISSIVFIKEERTKGQNRHVPLGSSFLDAWHAGTMTCRGAAENGHVVVEMWGKATQVEAGCCQRHNIDHRPLHIVRPRMLDPSERLPPGLVVCHTLRIVVSVVLLHFFFSIGHPVAWGVLHRTSKRTVGRQEVLSVFTILG